MKYQFRSETETVYIEADYRLSIVSSNGMSLKDGKSVLTAVVRRISDGTEVEFDGSCFMWKRHEDSESFTPLTGKTITVTSDMLVSGSATFICYFEKAGLYWKDNASISISATNQGANAPYQRTIYIAAAEKPERPSGNASTLPSGWSLQPPPRTNGWKIYASVGYVTFDENNAPVYSEWSDPVEWTGESVLPKVQWKWGDSSKYPPNVTRAILVIDGNIVIYSDNDDVSAFIDEDEGDEWFNKIPEDHEGKPYLWKREYNYQHTSEEDEWFYYPVNGIQGFDGAYQSIGYIIVGTNSVIFAGLDEDKNPTLSTIHIFIQDISYYLQSAQFTLNEKSDIFYLVTPFSETGVSALQVAYLDYVSDGTTASAVWKDHLTDETIADGFVLAEIRMNAASIDSVSIVIPRRFEAQQKVSFMELLNSGRMDDINIAAEALGVERVFTKVAALEAFINVLRANEALITAFKTQNFQLQSGRMRVKIGVINNSPIFQASYRNNDGVWEDVFYMHFSSGRIFFGKPNSTYTAPENGFMYDPADSEYGACIKSANNNVIITEDGKLIAKQADIRGKITATSGTMDNITINETSVFKGLFNAAAIYSKPGTNEDQAVFSGSYAGALSLLTDLDDEIGVETGRYYPCKMTECEAVEYIYVVSIASYPNNMGFCDLYFCDSNKNYIQIEDYGIKLKSGTPLDPTIITTGNFRLMELVATGDPINSLTMYDPTSASLSFYIPEKLKLYVPKSDTGEGLENNQVYRKSDGTLCIKKEE